MRENTVEKWLWLTTIPKMDSRKITYLLDALNDIQTIYAATEDMYQKVEGLSSEDIKNLLNKSQSRAQKIMSACQAMQATIVTYTDESYPAMLRKIFDPPYVLYAKGNLNISKDALAIAMVGARRPSEYGKKVAYDLSYQLAKRGALIVSGMARGLDSVAAKAALKAGRETVAVLGCGIDVVYPPENAALEDAICQHGLVLTEYPPGTPPLGSHFPKRNRIISGLSHGVVVVEASKTSGSLITADMALSQDRDVFAVPGSIYSGLSAGTNRLIAQGAKLVQSSEDILEEYINYMPQVLKKETADKSENEAEIKKQTSAEALVQSYRIDDARFRDLSPDQKNIIAALIAGMTSCEELAQHTKLPIAKLLSALTVLEIQGFIKSLPGKNYRIQDR